MKYSEYLTNQNHTSFFAIANKALREKNYDHSIEYYVKALLGFPQLSETISQNLIRAKHKRLKNRIQTPDFSGVVAICGCDRSEETTDRAIALARIYKLISKAEIIICDFDNNESSKLATINRKETAVQYFTVENQNSFLEYLLDFVIAHPYDVLHLAGPSAVNIFFGIFYKVIWNAKIIVDTGNIRQDMVNAEASINSQEYFAKNGRLPKLNNLNNIEWKKIAASLVNDFDAVTGPNHIKKNQFEGVCLSDQDSHKSSKLLANLLVKVFAGNTRNSLSMPLLLMIRALHQQQKNKITGAIVSISNSLSDYTIESGVTVILLNSDEAPLSEKFLSSFLLKNSYHPVELLVIDSSKSNYTSELVKQYQKQLQISCVKRNNNLSISESFNLGIEKARYSNLLFLNRSFVFTSDVLPAAIDRLRKPEIGVVGVKVEINSKEKSKNQSSQVEHAGVMFKWNEARQYHQPEIFSNRNGGQVNHIESGFFPAVSGGFLFCKKTDLIKLKGFSLDFNNGLEDVDLCLRYDKELNKKVWCINDLSIQADNSGSQLNLADKSYVETAQNHQSFKSKWLKRCEKYSGDKFPVIQHKNNLIKRRTRSNVVLFDERVMQVSSEKPAEPAWTSAASAQISEGYVALNMLDHRLALVKDSSVLNQSEQTHVDIQSLHAFCDLYGLSFCDSISYYKTNDQTISVTSNVETCSSLSKMVLNDFSENNIAITDIWYTTDFKLRIRIESAGHRVFQDSPCIVNCYQLDIKLGTVYVNSETPLYNQGPQFIELSLYNPYAPILLVANDCEARLIGMTLLPFPSLCRGGMHNGELSSIGIASPYLSKLKRMSNDFLMDFFNQSDVQRKFSIGQIKVDINNATGAEKIFSAPIKEWLKCVMGIHCISMNQYQSDEKIAVEFIKSSLNSDVVINIGKVDDKVADRKSAGTQVLILPSKGLPTISALLSKQLHLSGHDDFKTGSFIVSNPVNGQLHAEVILPDMGEPILSIQPRNNPITFPLLEALSTEPVNDLGVRSNKVDIPLAILYQEYIQQRPSSLLYPLAPDQSSPVLRRDLSLKERKTIQISVLIHIKSSGDHISALLNSLSLQTLSDRLFLILIIDGKYSADQEKLVSILTLLFPERFTLLKLENEDSCAILNQASEKVIGSYFLVANDTTILHDSRSVEVLYLMMVNQKVATTSCVILNDVNDKKGINVKFHSGGIFPVEVDCQDNPVVKFKHQLSLTAFPNSTYPVAGNSFDLVLINKQIWDQLGGLDIRNLDFQAACLDFCLHAQSKNYIHLCTSAVTASNLKEQKNEVHLNIHADGWVDFFRLQETLSCSSVIREAKL